MRHRVLFVGVAVGLVAIVAAWDWSADPEPRGIVRGEPATPAVPAPTEVAEPTDVLAHDDRRVASVVTESAAEAAAPAPAAGGAAAVLVIQARAKETRVPLAGIRLLLWPEPAERGFAITQAEGPDAVFGESPVTDASGRARIEVPAGRRFRLSSDGESGAQRANLTLEPLAAGEQREIELVLATGSDLRFVVRVLSDESGSPLPSASARIGSAYEIFHDGRIGGEQAACDADGLIEIEVKSWSEHVARIEAPEHAWVPVPIAKGHESRETAREVRLRRAAVVEAQVVSPGGMALEGIGVVLSAELYELSQSGAMSDLVFASGPARWRARTDAYGRCRIEGLPPSVPLELSARVIEEVTRVPGSIVLEPGEVRAIEIPLGGGAVVRGRMLYVDGRAAAGQEIWMRDRGAGAQDCLRSFERDEVRTASTDAAGRFEFADVLDGVWIVGCSPEGPFAPHSVAVAVAGGRADREPDLMADASLSIRGRVLDPEGKPVSAKVYAVGKQHGCFSEADAGKDGEFSIGPLVGGGYVLSAMAMGENMRSGWTRSDALEVAAGASDVVIHLSRGGSISGRVVDALTGESVRADVTAACSAGAEESCGAWLTTTEDGHFDFDGLGAGTYTVSARTSGVQVAVRAGLRVSAGQELDDLVLTLEPGARLRVRYEGEVSHCQVSVRRDGVPVVFDGLQSGRDSTYVVPAGALSVVCEVYRGTRPTTRTRTVEVAVGGLAEVAFGPDED